MNTEGTQRTRRTHARHAEHTQGTQGARKALRAQTTNTMHARHHTTTLPNPPPLLHPLPLPLTLTLTHSFPQVHPIQFANSITRINVAARAHRDKSLYLLLLFLLGILVLSIYPFMDLTYYLYIVLIFAPLSILEYIGYSFLQTRV